MKTALCAAIALTTTLLVGCGAGTPSAPSSGETTAESGSATPSSGESSTPQPLASTPLKVLNQAQVRTILRGHRTTVNQVPNSNKPTLACEEATLRSLNPTRSALSEFDGSALGQRLINTHIATAALEFPTSAAARTAFNTVRGWLKTCTAPFESPHPVRGAGKVTSTSTTGGEAVFRTLSAAAPEACSECDTGWYDSQGVGFAGPNRIVVVSFGYISDMQLEPDPAFEVLLQKAVQVATAH